MVNRWHKTVLYTHQVKRSRQASDLFLSETKKMQPSKITVAEKADCAASRTQKPSNSVWIAFSKFAPEALWQSGNIS